MATTAPEIQAAPPAGGGQDQPEASPPHGAVVRVLGPVALLVGSFAVALILAEVVVRIFAPQQLVLIRPDIWQPVDSVGWRFRPNLNTTVNTGERTVHVYTDRDGFRVGRAGRVAAATRALLIGDSFMAALQVEYEQSLAGLLEERLPGDVGRPVEIRNAGQAGWDTPQYFLEARSTLNRDSFALMVVSVYLGNDVFKTRPEHIPPRLPVETYEFRLPRHLTGGEFVAAFFRPINDFLKRRSHAFVFFKTRLHTTLLRLGLAADDFPEEFLKSQAASPRWDVTSGILADIAGLASRKGIPTLFVLIPAPFQVEPAVFQRYVRGFRVDSSQFYVDQPTRLMRDRLQARGLAVLDVLPAFRAADRQGARLYGSVDPHLTPHGHEVLEALVAPRIAALLQQPVKRGPRP